MISCTEFIPAYSELFAYLEEKGGKEEVLKYWDYIFTPAGGRIPLIDNMEKYGIRGCYTYWAASLNEEAADFTMYLNEKAGWFLIEMHRCPSKGKLLDLKESIGITPYRDYCLHCDYYRLSVEKMGFKYIYNFAGTDHAACSILIYDPKLFDGRVIVDEDTEVMDRRAADNEYFHRHFHTGLNSGITFLNERMGKDAVIDFLTIYATNVHNKLIQKIKAEGLAPLKEDILNTYKKEKSEDAVEVLCDENVLEVNVKYCPAVKFLREINFEVTPLYKYSTETVMETIAKESGLSFEMISYDDESGAAKYKFTK